MNGRRGSAGRALAAALGAALLLLAGWLLHEGLPLTPGEPAMVIQPEQMLVAKGKGQPGEAGLTVVSEPPDDRALIVLAYVPLETEGRPILELSVAGLHPGAQLRLLWRPVGGAVRSRQLPAAEGRLWLRLLPEEGWQGTVDQLALLLFDQPREPFRIERAVLHAPSAGPALQALWDDFRRFEGWSGHSINFLYGGGEAQRLRPLPVVAAWVALSLTLYALLAWRAGRFAWRAAGGLFLAGWLLLDLRWSEDLRRQHALSAARYAAPAAREQQMAAPDRDLFLFAERVKGLLPPAPARVVIVVPQSEATRYFRLRMAWHLLPHQVYAPPDPPPLGRLRKGDYLLFLGGQPAAVVGEGLLSWGGEQAAAERLLQEPSGSLYRLLGP